MKINGQEISFDIDNRSDQKRFLKASEALLKKIERIPANHDDMEIFLTGCIKSQEVEKLLKDGKVSTLVKVFAEFYSQAMEQFEMFKESTEAANNIIKNTNQKFSQAVSKDTTTEANNKKPLAEE